MKYKTLKFSAGQANEIIAGQQTKTWRLFDDKQLDVGDRLQLINGVDGQVFGYAVIKRITVKYLSDLNADDMQGHEYFSSTNEVLTEFRRYYGPGVEAKDVVKVIDFDFLGTKEPKNVVNKPPKTLEVKIFTDGGSRGNPGPSACAFVITDMNDSPILKDGHYLGVTTNNQAEYQAVLKSLQAAKAAGYRTIHVYMDSLLVVNQMNDIFKVRNRDLWPIYEAVKALVSMFEKVYFAHIPRELNKEADAQVNMVLDNQPKSGIGSELL
jgi:ribonuclease HI